MGIMVQQRPTRDTSGLKAQQSKVSATELAAENDLYKFAEKGEGLELTQALDRHNFSQPVLDRALLITSQAQNVRFSEFGNYHEDGFKQGKYVMSSLLEGHNFKPELLNQVLINLASSREYGNTGKMEVLLASHSFPSEILGQALAKSVDIANPRSVKMLVDHGAPVSDGLLTKALKSEHDTVFNSATSGDEKSAAHAISGYLEGGQSGKAHGLGEKVLLAGKHELMGMKATM